MFNVGRLKYIFFIANIKMKIEKNIVILPKRITITLNIEFYQGQEYQRSSHNCIIY
jgi:hypothetical protein